MFDKEWIEKAQKVTDAESWAHSAMLELDTTGGIYINTLRMWYEEFPGSKKQKKPLRQRIENFGNEDHLGGVNELSWWKFLQKGNFSAEPVPTATSARPDFKVQTPTEFFVEVSTLNVSANEKQQLESEVAISLDHAETLRRLLLKSTNDKHEQMSFACNQQRPCCLVLFDYTTWSAFGTQFFRYLASYLFGENGGFTQLPSELSALIYVERKVIDGHIGLSRDRSAVYYNPNAKYPLARGTFTELRQYWHQMVEVEPQWKDYWVWL